VGESKASTRCGASEGSLKAILLTTVASILYTGLITVVFRAWSIRARAATMTRVFLLTLPVLASAYWLTPADLAVLPQGWGDDPVWLGLAFTLILYSAAFFGGILQLYNLADRGFSLRMLIDIDEAPTGALSLQEVIVRYSRGKGIHWMYQRRLDGLCEQGLVELDGQAIRNTPKGQRTAEFFDRLQRFCRIDAAGE
jgi:hypothetical protein